MRENALKWLQNAFKMIAARIKLFVQRTRTPCFSTGASALYTKTVTTISVLVRHAFQEKRPVNVYLFFCFGETCLSREVFVSRECASSARGGHSVYESSF